MATLSKTGEIVSLSSGFLECRTCGVGTHWCDHIQTYITDGHDAEDIWDETQGGNLHLGGVQLRIPIVPTLSQWATVQFGEEFHGNYKIHLLLPVEFNDKTGEVTKGGSEFLGFLSPGEGRQIIRQMIFDWFTPRAGNNECLSTSHNFQAQLQWEKDVIKASNARGRRQLAQRWSVLSTSQCLFCSAVTAAVGGDDLVPDAGKTTTPWRSR